MTLLDRNIYISYWGSEMAFKSPFDNFNFFNPFFGLSLDLGQAQTQESDPDLYQTPIRNPAECILK
jgi:hypothetical protein